MKKYLVMMIAAMSFVAFNVNAGPATFTTGGTKLVKNGEGNRSVFGIKVYQGTLYLEEKSTNANAIVKADKPMAFRMKITSGLITKDKMEKIVYEGFAKSTGSKTAMRPQVDKLLGVFANGIKNGDVYDLVYVPGKGTHTYKNGKLGAVTPGLKFKQALFGLWIGSSPAQGSLKKSLLGK